MEYKHNKKLIPFAKDLRKNMTDEEKHLWYDCLRKQPIRFIRQKTIGHYILDFYCPAAKLAIELDGSQHLTKEGREYDAKRTAFLEGYGIHVMRIQNIEIKRNFVGVCDTVCSVAKRRMEELSNPSTTAVAAVPLPRAGVPDTNEMSVGECVLKGG